jgi:hypothetical protein
MIFSLIAGSATAFRAQLAYPESMITDKRTVKSSGPGGLEKPPRREIPDRLRL